MADANRSRKELSEELQVLRARVADLERQVSLTRLLASEARYRTLVETMNEGLVMVDALGRITYVNPRFCELLGCDREQIIGRQAVEFIRSADIPFFQQETARRREVHHSRYELRLLAPNGREIPVVVSVQALFDPEKNFQGSFAVVTDISMQKQAEKQVYRLESAINQSAEGVAVSDLEGNLQFINQAFAKLHGYEPEELLGKNLSIFHTSEQMPVLNAANEQIHQTGSFTGETWHVRRDHSVFPGRMQKSLLRDEQGKAVGMIGILTDISELKKITQELSELREKISLAEQISQVSLLGAALAHELNQPLSVIRLLMQENREMLNEMSCPAAVRDNCNEVLAAVSRAVDIIHRYRHYASLPRKQRTKDINLVQLAERIRQVLSESALMAKVDIHLNLPEEMPLVEGDVRELEQIFFILMQNAIQAADGRQEHTLKIEGEIGADKIILKFADDCGGIPPESRDKIFEPFFTTKPSGKGTGLGLSILERILRDNNGSVDLESRLGHGSTFVLRLPLQS